MAGRVRRPAELVLGLRIAGFALIAPALVRLRPSRLARILEPSRRPPAASSEELRQLAGRIDHVLAAGRPLLARGCLVRGVTLYYFLSRAGADVRLVFGMGKVDEAFEGHCWLVRNGEPYLERTDPRATFAEVYSIGSAGA